MKKLFSLILCITVLSITALCYAAPKEDKHEETGISGISAREIYIIPGEKTELSAPVHAAPVNIENPAMQFESIKNIRREDKYFPDILEQIDIISVAPRE